MTYGCLGQRYHTWTMPGLGDIVAVQICSRGGGGFPDASSKSKTGER